MRRATRRWLSIIALALAVAALAACGGSDGSPVQTPASSITPPGPGGESTLTPTPPPPDTPYWLVYREFGAQQDIIWRVRPADLASREQLAVVQHSDGCGIRASLSPDGRTLAYIAQPAGAPCDASASKAEAHVIDVLGHEDEKIAEGVDLQFTPLWAPDSRLLYFRRYAGPEFLAADVFILRTEVVPKPLPGERTPEPTPEPTPPAPAPEDPVKVVMQDKVSTVLAFVPLGFADDGKTMYFIQVQGGTGGGTLAGAFAPATTESIATATAEAEATATALAQQTVTAGGTVVPNSTIEPPLTATPLASFLVRLSDQIAFDFDLSADRRRLTFVAQELMEGQFVDRTFIADLPGKSVAPLAVEGLAPGDQLSPRWHPDGQRLAIGTLPSGGEPGAVALVSAGGGPATFLPGPPVGFDDPQAWAPDGAYLAVTSKTGESLTNPGAERLDLVAPTGQRMTIAEGGDLLVIGWNRFEAPPQE